MDFEKEFEQVWIFDEDRVNVARRVMNMNVEGWR
jgi:hypothetical protein